MSNILGVHWRINRRLFLWLGAFVLAGAVIGFTVVLSPDVTTDVISSNLLDANLLVVINIDIGFGAIVLGRLLDFALVAVLAFLVCLHRWTVFLAFALAAYRGFSLVVNLYWVIASFGLAAGLTLFIIYLVLLLVLTVILLAVIVFCLRGCAEVRRGGFRGGMRWREFLQGLGVFVGIVLVFAVIEWIFYWLILSKIVFIV